MQKTNGSKPKGTHNTRVEAQVTLSVTRRRAEARQGRGISRVRYLGLRTNLSLVFEKNLKSGKTIEEYSKALYIKLKLINK